MAEQPGAIPATTKSETIIRNSNRCRQQEQGPRHFNATGNTDPSGNANTPKVEPSRKDAWGNNAAATLPKIVPCQPVGVATYCRPFTEYEIADPRWPAPV